MVNYGDREFQRNSPKKEWARTKVELYSKAPSGAKQVLMAIADLSKDDGTGCYAKVSTIARKCGRKDPEKSGLRSVRLNLRTLEKLGELIVRKQKSRYGTNEYIIPFCKYSAEELARMYPADRPKPPQLPLPIVHPEKLGSLLVLTRTGRAIHSPRGENISSLDDRREEGISGEGGKNFLLREEKISPYLYLNSNLNVREEILNKEGSGVDNPTSQMSEDQLDGIRQMWQRNINREWIQNAFPDLAYKFAQSEAEPAPLEEPIEERNTSDAIFSDMACELPAEEVARMSAIENDLFSEPTSLSGP